MSSSSGAQSQPPQPFAEFPDHYIRNEDIIRPKPRRLVDMRRSAVSIESPSLRESPIGTCKPNNNGIINPPILPAKPSSYLMKPLPPRPSSTNSSLTPILSNNIPQAQQPTYNNNNNNNNNNNSGNNNGRRVHSVTPSSFNSISQSPTSLLSTTTQNFNINVSQRSVPNLPQLFQIQQQQQQQKRNLFSPPYGSSTNLNNNNISTSTRNNNNCSSSSPQSNGSSSSSYYTDLISNSIQNNIATKSLSASPPHKNLEIQPRSRVRVEWKSVENLQQGYTPRLISGNIDFGEIINKDDGNRLSSSSSISTSAKNLTAIFQQTVAVAPIIRNDINIQHQQSGEYTHIFRDDEPSTTPLASPDYDQIRSPPERLKESPSLLIKDKDKEKIISSSSPVNNNNNNNTSNGNLRNSKIGRDIHVHHGSGQGFQHTTRLGKIPLGLFPISPSGNTAIGITNSTESTTDGSSLGRSSTSDGDFGTLGSPSLVVPLINSTAVNNTGSGVTPSPSNRKPRHPASLSKLKSRRRNILQHLSMEDMKALNNNNNNNNNNSNNQRYNNTGTGGSSSSDGSSGHASMSDSQTSGSPPAPAEYARITAPNQLLSHSYKSVLKSVPEDETNLNLNGLGSRPLIGEKSDGSKSNIITQNPIRESSSGKKSSTKSRHRNNKESILLENGNSGLEDIKQAIEQLTLRSYQNGPTTTASGHGLHLNSDKSTSSGGHHGRADHHSSYSTSTYSSMSGSECDRHRRPHLIRHSSLETINTQVTSADEFVWVDSHNRLVELQHFPWSNHDILKVIERNSRLRDNLERISMETVPRISYLLQRALVRISREAQRLSRPFGFCSKQEVSSALRIVLAPALADSCVKACQRAAAMFSVSTTDPLHRESKSLRAGLHLHVGRFHRWMCEVRLGKYVHEFAAIHLAAGMENLIEEILGQALSFITTNVTPENNHTNNSGRPVLTAALLEQAIANNGDFWGLLQPFAHLNSGRTASGALALPRWASVASVDSSGSSSTTLGGNQDDTSLRHYQHKNLEQSLLTTCVGSIGELADILSRVLQYHHKQVPLSNGSKSMAPSWSPSAIHTLFYFMRCSQLETSDEHTNLDASTATLGSETIERQPHQSNRVPVQELVYERPFIVLPPLIEWVRVATAHADHRHSWLIDKDDVMQASRLLLPGIDCPVRLTGSEEFSWPRRPIDEFECNRRLKIDLAFNMLTSGRSDLVAQALLLMPPSKANTFNETGLSPLILATVRGEEGMVTVLLTAGADPDAETPANSQNFPHANSETQHWTALTFASLMSHTNIVKILLEHGANVEGGIKLSEEKSTQTPLQVAAATGNLDIVSTLLNYGANPFFSTLARDSLCYMGSAQRGSFSAISVAGAHGQRVVIHKLLSHPLNTGPSAKEVLSLEEILAEGVQHSQSTRNGLRNSSGSNNNGPEEPKILSKSQMKILQEGMYQSAENGHLEITLDLRNLGVPWTLHCWVNALATAQDLRCEPVVDQLLQDFLQILPNEDFSQGHFVEECLPLLFTIFRNSKVKNEGTTLLLADIFQTCYGRDPIKEIRDTTLSNGTRIDPKYVNNSELSDVQFRVEGKVFYAHKIVLVTSSPRFKSMLKSAPESNPPILQINDIRYHIFQMVMEYLYNGGCDSIRNTESEDVLELMAAANFFQLDGLLRFSEARCSQMVNIETVVSLYIHAKVYNAVQLLDYCQGFLLQNMVASLTYDDSVRRLVFGKKLHNHDVLAGLLLTLQSRLKCTSSLNNSSGSNRKSK